MIEDIKGWIFTKAEFEYTREYPRSTFETEEEWKDKNKSMKSNLLPVWDIAVDGSGYLAFVREHGGFLWDIDKRDTTLFMEGDVIGDMRKQISKMGRDTGLGLSGEEFMEIAKELESETGIPFSRYL